VNQLRVIGGVCDCCLRAGMSFYSSYTGIEGDVGGETYPTTMPSFHRSLGIHMYSVSNIEIAETTKVVENAHRYLQIAFAEELYLCCQANNIKFPELRDALNTKWNVEILEPREGIGGHCLPKDTKMFLQSTSRRKSSIIEAAMEIDEDYKRYRAKLEPHIESPAIEHNSK
jgi:UDP-N-acetyl-D-mannosaminuronic acid dehydrogenase